jgi:hypothetical protein
VAILRLRSVCGFLLLLVCPDYLFLIL